MSSPLPLRICCIAAMAPALTEAASQVRIKATLPAPNTPSTTLSTPVFNGKDHKLTEHRALTVDSILSLEKAHRPNKQVTTLASHLLKGGHSVKLSTCDLASNLQSLGVATPLSHLHKKEVSAFQCEFIKSFSKLQNGGMNQPAIQNDMTKSGTESLKEPSESSTLVNGKSLPPESSWDGNSKDENLKNECNNVVNQSVKISQTECELARNTAYVEEAPVPETSSKSEVEVETKEDLKASAIKTQFHLERRTEFLFRRLRRLQSRNLETHCRQQLHHFVEYQHKNLETVVKAINTPVSGTELKTELLQSEDVKNLSTAALVNLVRKLQAPKNLSLNQRLVNPPKSETVIQTTTNILKMDKSVRNESELKSDHACSVLKFAESAVDSDATESSSGGDSCDEYDVDLGKERKVPQTPLHRRAEWKWAIERAAVASRWTWLQAQVSDLEYRIRQQSEIYKQIRNSKGSIVLGDAPSPQNILTRFHPSAKQVQRVAGDGQVASLEKKTDVSPCNISTVLSNIDKQASRLSQSLGNCLTPPQNSIKSSTPSSGRSLNGFIESPISSTEGDDSVSPASSDMRQIGDHVDVSLVDHTTQAARCRPLRSYRKRKLLRTFGLHQTNRKAARLSSVKCECYPPVMPCSLCGGRYNNTQTVDQDVMSVHERVSLLDPSFHPVLSFPQEVPLPVHFESLLESGEWQHKQPPTKRTKFVADKTRRHKVRGGDTNNRKPARQIRKNAAAVLLSTKIRSKYEHKTGRKGRNSRKKGVSSRRLNKEIKRRAQQLALVMKRRSGRSVSALMLNDAMHGSLLSPLNKDGLSLSCPSSTMKDFKNRKNRGENAYDINNIVIPYSIAAATRVEKLQYKEIVTPKWRDVTVEGEPFPDIPVASKIVEDENVMQEENEEEEIEDLSDEACSERHLKCEIEEKKRFTSFIQYPARRGRTRTDNSTVFLEPPSPDLSSAAADMQLSEGLPDSIVHPVQLPPPPRPPTPSTPLLSTYLQNASVAAVVEDGGRRRSGSVSRRERSISGMDDSSQDYTFELGECVDPWPLRTFPLAEEEYNEMKKVQPVLEKLRPRVSLEPPNTPGRSDSTPSNSHPCSPLPSSASNSSVAGDDPNDPEWLGVNSEKMPKMSVVLKLSTKR